jgi:hypothetical protein
METLVLIPKPRKAPEDHGAFQLPPHHVLLAIAQQDGITLVICMNVGCDFVAHVEPDQRVAFANAAQTTPSNPPRSLPT